MIQDTVARGKTRSETEDDNVLSMIQNAMKNEDGEDIVDIREAWDDAIHVHGEEEHLRGDTSGHAGAVDGDEHLHGCIDSDMIRNSIDEEDMLLDIILEELSEVDIRVEGRVRHEHPKGFGGFTKGFLSRNTGGKKEMIEETQEKNACRGYHERVVGQVGERILPGVGTTCMENTLQSSLKKDGSAHEASVKKPLSKFKLSRIRSANVPSEIQ